MKGFLPEFFRIKENSDVFFSPQGQREEERGAGIARRERNTKEELLG